MPSRCSRTHTLPRGTTTNCGLRSLGVVTADAEGRALLDLALTESTETLQGFAISLEPPGGSPDPRAPTGPVIVVGTRA